MFKTNLHPNESVEKIYRQTELVLIRPVLIIFLLIYVPWTFLLKYDLIAQFKRILLFWTILVLIYGINKYLLWLLNSYIITNQRVIDVVYHHIFQKEVFETPLERILNINYKQKGFLQSILNYGDVEVQIVGLVEPLIFKRVRNPEKIKDILWHIHVGASKQSKTEFTPEEIPQIQQRIGYHSKKR